jgi:hypothetical protein
VRAALKQMLDQDGAVYGSKRFYSFTATHWRHASDDVSDSSTGQFMALVLAARDDESNANGAPRLVDELRALLDRPDDLYRLTAPLLPEGDDAMGPPPDPVAETRTQIERLTAPGAPLRAFQDAAARMAPHLARAEKTTALQRLVTLGSFGVALHLANATDAALDEGERTPLLLCKSQNGGPRRSIKDASRRTFKRARRRLTYAFENELAAEFARRGDDDEAPAFYESEMKNWLVTADLDGSEREQAEEQFEEFRRAFDAEREDDASSTLDAFVRAAAPVCFSTMAKPPSGCLTRLGRHVGLLVWSGGGYEKYYRPAPQFLDMLAAALLAPDEGAVTAADFWNRAYKQFGILCGARGRRDAEILREYGVLQVSVEHLRENADALHDQLTRLGHARTYADGVTLLRVDQ